MVSLSVLVVLTILGITAVATGVLQQKMTSNFSQSALSFEAAEVALEGVIFESNDPLRYIDGDDPLSEARMSAVIDRENDAPLSCNDSEVWIERTVTKDGLQAGQSHVGNESLFEEPETKAWSRTAFYRETACLGSSVVMGHAKVSCHNFMAQGCGQVAQGPIITANSMSLSVMAPGGE